MGYCSCNKVIVERKQDKVGWYYLVTCFDDEPEAGCKFRKVPYEPEEVKCISADEAFRLASKKLNELSM